MTSRMLPRIEPTSEALTTSCSPFSRANRAMISSGALPKVTLRSPPMTLPERSASSSVARPIIAAGGIRAIAETKKITAAGAPTRSTTIAAAISGESRYGQLSAPIRRRFCGDGEVASGMGGAAKQLLAEQVGALLQLGRSRRLREALLVRLDPRG